MTELELRNQVVAIMEDWVGLKESNGSFKPIIDLYNKHKPLARGYKVKYTDHWCATTVSAAFIKAGLTDIAPTECSCAKMIENYKTIGRWEERDSYSPAVGDIIMYDWDDDGKGDNTGHPEHVGIVSKILGNTITVIEGNKSESVAKRTIQVDGKYIRGYCLPDYASKATKKTTNTATTPSKSAFESMEMSVPILLKGAKGEPVEALQALLNLRANAKLDVDSSFGPSTDKAVKNYQKAEGLTVDGSVGAATWTKLIGG